MSDQQALPKRYGTCAFCSMDVVDVYKCSRCRQPFCSLKCYRSRAHAECSDRFYQEQIAQHLKDEEKVDSDDESEDEKEQPSVSQDEQKPTVSNSPDSTTPNYKLTFSEYMQKHWSEDQTKTEEELNPEIPLGPDEELVFDSDDEPEYLNTVATDAMRDFEALDEKDLDRQLASMNFDVDNEEELLKLLTPDERRAFQRLANEMFNTPESSCFK
ncbi:hypothetical protein M3Y94_00983700 [Aphelenchoides besseyi]|nr:hypothetical protein M3Y94_00983700 [Aphelenchoides besseyi]KAI6221083.1 HIT-type domain-containing protein [Aphelenchoides besseyi]